MLEKFKSILLDEKTRISQTIRREAEVDTDGDEIDEIQAGLITALQNQLSIRDKEKLAQIDKALIKINSKTFGACDDCGEEIPEKRLSFNPYSSTCVSCAEEREMRTRKIR